MSIRTTLINLYTKSTNSFKTALTLGILLRLTLIFYGSIVESFTSLSYTDVDYYVFDDASKFMLQGSSPYNRSTYRYTPVLALMLIPNHIINHNFGKFLFAASDILVAYLFQKIFKLRGVTDGTSTKIISLSWLLNPFIAIISTRGNCESILLLLVLFSLYSFLNNKFKTGCISLASAIHFKIYPIIYMLPLLLLLDKEYPRQKKLEKRLGKRATRAESSRLPISVVISTFVKSQLPIQLRPLINETRLEFLLFTAAPLILITFICATIYPDDFLEHALLYHVRRVDHRHNFSIYFYPLYLTTSSVDNGLLSLIVGLLAFLPQLVMVAFIGLWFYKDIFLATFLQTLMFVNYNKVCTSQYFIWYLGLLPTLVPFLNIPSKEAFKMVGIWLTAQAVWLAPAFLLEMKGYNTFTYLFLASILLFLSHIYIALKVINSYNFRPLFKLGKIQV